MNPRKLFVQTTLVCLLLIVALFTLSVKKIDRIPLNVDPPKFNQDQAFQYMKTLAKDYPRRMTWTDSRKKAALWLKGELKKMGYTPQGMQFSEVIDGKEYQDLENIYAVKRGEKFPDEYIVLAGHYDVPDTTIEGAMDDASGVGVVLEMARLLSNQRTSRSIIFLMTDSEEFGALWGAINFSRRYENARKIIAVLNFDFVGSEDQVGILTLPDGLRSGYCPLWLRELALDSIRSFGEVKAVDLTNVSEHVMRALLIPAADHGAYLAEGIPAFNWVGQMENFAYQMGYYHHTPRDVVEILKPESFGTFGRAAERLLKSVDAIQQLPKNWREGSYWKISDHLYLSGWVTYLIHVLCFIPFVVLTLSKISFVRRKYSKTQIRNVLKNEIKHFGILFGSLLVGYGVMQLLPVLRIITQYEAFPATQKSAILYTPNFLALLIVGIVIGLTYWVFVKTFKEKQDSFDGLEIRHTVHLSVVALVIVLAMLKNSFLATLLLMPVAYFWAAMRSRRKVEDRILNTLFILGGTSVLIIMAIIMSNIFHIGVVYWYIFLAATYGLISAYAVALTFMIAAIFIRMIKRFVF